MSAEQKIYLSVDEIAAWFDVDPRTIERWAKLEPTMPVLRVANSPMYFHRARIEQWFRDRERQRALRSSKQVRPSSNPAPSQETATS
jgi:phage terminase Nu1 subunit (DNA packaging protein)